MNLISPFLLAMDKVDFAVGFMNINSWISKVPIPRFLVLFFLSQRWLLVGCHMIPCEPNDEIGDCFLIPSSTGPHLTYLLTMSSWLWPPFHYSHSQDFQTSLSLSSTWQINPNETDDRHDKGSLSSFKAPTCILISSCITNPRAQISPTRVGQQVVVADSQNEAWLYKS